MLVVPCCTQSWVAHRQNCCQQTNNVRYARRIRSAEQISTGQLACARSLAVLAYQQLKVVMSSSDSGGEDEQTADQHVTGGNADPQVLQYFWDLASLQQVDISDCAVPMLLFAVCSPFR